MSRAVTVAEWTTLDHRIYFWTTLAHDRHADTDKTPPPPSVICEQVFHFLMSRRGRSALDRPLPMRGKNEVGLSAFAFLFSEFIQYSQQRVNTAEELERK